MAAVLESKMAAISGVFVVVFCVFFVTNVGFWKMYYMILVTKYMFLGHENSYNSMII